VLTVDVSLLVVVTDTAHAFETGVVLQAPLGAGTRSNPTIVYPRLLSFGYVSGAFGYV
jgi:hypothetical protein